MESLTDNQVEDSLVLSESKNLPGIFNSTCPPHTCLRDQHLVCKEGYCRCELGYTVDSLGRCTSDIVRIVEIWISRLVIAAIVLFHCAMIIYYIIKRVSGRGGRSGYESLDQTRCWDEAPPPYVQVVQPPPSYLEAVSDTEKPLQTTDDTTSG